MVRTKPEGPWDSCPIYTHMLTLAQAAPAGSKDKATLGVYLGRLRAVIQRFEGRQLADIFCAGEESFTVMYSNVDWGGSSRQSWEGSYSVSTCAAYISAMLRAVREAKESHPAFREQFSEDLVKEWRAALDDVTDRADDARNHNKAGSEEQREGFVPYATLCALRDSLPISNPLRLYLAMSTLIPCQRGGEYASCRVYTKQLAAAPGGTANYVVLDATGTSYVHLRTFKTSKHYPSGIKIVLPPQLCQEIRTSLADTPREHLFVMEKKLQPWGNDRCFVNKMRLLLKTATRNRHATLQLVRRAYVTEAWRVIGLRQGSADPAVRAAAAQEQRQLAFCCAHSLTMHQKYRFDLDDGGQPELHQLVEATAPLSGQESAQPIACISLV